MDKKPKRHLNIIRQMDKKEPNKEKEKQTKEQKKPVHKNDHFRPYMCYDGYMHCNHCRRRWEPGHVCEIQYL